MANGPGDYRDPKVTTTETRSSMSWLWWLLGAIVLLLLLGWLLGWFGSEVNEAAVTTDEPTEVQPVAADDATTLEEGDPATDTALEGEPVDGTATTTTEEPAVE